MISRLAQSLSFDVHHRSPRTMTSVLTYVSRALNCEFTATDGTGLIHAYGTSLFGMHLILGALPNHESEPDYVLRGITLGLADRDTDHLDLSPHVASILRSGGAGQWDPST